MIRVCGSGHITSYVRQHFSWILGADREFC